MLAEEIMPIETQKMETFRRDKKKNKRLKKIILWIAAILIIAFLVFLNFWFKNLYLDLYEVTKSIINEVSLMTYLKILLLNALLQMCFVPGISFFIMFIGFISKNYFYAISLVYPSTLIICATTYLLTRYTIKEYLENKLKSKWYFKMFYKESEKKPWETSFMLRFILIPVTYKNYLIGLMEINFIQFIVPAILFYLPYFSSYVLIGMTISSIQSILDGKITDAERQALIIYSIVYVTLILLSLIFCGYLIKMTCRLRKKYREICKQEEILTLQNQVN